MPHVWSPIVSALPAEDKKKSLTCPPLDDIDALAERLSDEVPEHSILVGHSFGGYVALAIMARCVKRLSGLVLINSNTTADSPTAAEARETAARRAENGEYLEMARAAAVRTYHADSLANESIMAQREQDLVGYGAEDFAAHQRACAKRPDRTLLLRDFSAPKLIIAASEDQIIPASVQRKMATEVRASFVSIPSAGHMLPAEKPLLLAEALASWQSKVFMVNSVE